MQLAVHGPSNPSLLEVEKSAGGFEFRRSIWEAGAGYLRVTLARLVG